MFLFKIERKLQQNIEIAGEESHSDELYMRRCLQLARLGEQGAAPNPMVGAVVVCDGRIIGEGYHRRCGGPHAEVNAIASVRDEALLLRSTIYVSLEPCAHYGKTPPCADLIISKGIPRVVVGCVDPFAKVNGLGIKKLRNAGVDVKVGVLDKECRWLNRRFMTFHGEHRPWVTLKWAESADGFIDGVRDATQPASRLSSPVTSIFVHRLRARRQAILVGTNTALMDNPTLTTRLWPGENPLRLVIDRYGSLPQSLHLMDGTVPTHFYGGEALSEILADLYGRGIQSLIVEGGARLLQSFIDQGLWDEARVEKAPFPLGDGVRAPQLANELVVERETIDNHEIVFYESFNTKARFS